MDCFAIAIGVGCSNLDGFVAERAEGETLPVVYHTPPL
jgi:hypothetical protein